MSDKKFPVYAILRKSWCDPRKGNAGTIVRFESSTVGTIIASNGTYHERIGHTEDDWQPVYDSSAWRVIQA